MFSRIALIFAVSLLAVSTFGQARVQPDKRIAFTSDDAPWILSFALDGFTIDQQKQSQQGGRYFLLTSQATGVNASLFIEPAVKCKTASACRDLILNAGNPLWENPTELKKAEMPPASIFQFHMASFRGQPIRQQHIYAQFVEEGFWVDMHVSKTLYEAKDRPLLENIVRSAKFESKAGKASEAVINAATEWLTLWDGGKIDEAYAKLSSDSPSKMTKQVWSTYFSGVRKPLGALKSRKLTGSKYLLEVAGVPGQDGYILQYESSFEKAPTVNEMVALIRDKNGLFCVGHYLSNFNPPKTAD